MNTTEMVQIALDLAQLQELPLDSSVSVPGENITRVLAGIVWRCRADSGPPAGL